MGPKKKGGGEGKKGAKEKRLSHASSDNEFSWFSSQPASGGGGGRLALRPQRGLAVRQPSRSTWSRVDGAGQNAAASVDRSAFNNAPSEGLTIILA